jgi:hypothetical protein
MPSAKKPRPVTVMPTDAVEMYKKTSKTHNEVFLLINNLRSVAAAGGASDILEIANVAYAIKQSLNLIESTRKDLNALHDQFCRLACVRWVQQVEMAMTDGTEPEDNIKTDFCTATPDIKQIAAIPTRKRDPEGFASLMRFLEIPESVWNVPEECEVVRPHFPGLVDMLSDRASKGLPLPAGIDPHKTYPQYKLVTRGLKGVDE